MNRRTWGAVVAAVLGVIALLGAWMLTRTTVEAAVDIPDSDAVVTVSCGTALEAWRLADDAFITNGDEPLEFPDEADFSEAASLSAHEVRELTAAADDACRDEAARSIWLAIALGLVGVAGLGAAGYLAIRHAGRGRESSEPGAVGER